MNEDRMQRLERLSAYLAGDLDAGEAAALEAEVEADPSLQAELESLEQTQALLAELPDESPSPQFSRRLREIAATAAREGPARDELAARREGRERSRWSPLRPLAIAAAAAGVIALVGVGAGVLLRGGGDDAGTAAMAPLEEATAEQGYVPTVPVVESDNDYGDLELQRLAVNADTQFVVPPDLDVEGARELEDELVPQVTGGRLRDLERASKGEVDALSDDADGEGGGDSVPSDEDAAAEPRPAASPDVQEFSAQETEPRAVAARCLPAILEETDTPIVPVYVELATYEDIPAIVFTFASLEPDSGEYDRTEVWAMARSDCHTLQFAQYTRSGS